MTDTPRTDGFVMSKFASKDDLHDALREHARQLERELNASRLSPPAVAQSSTRGREPFAWYTEHDGGGAYFRLTVYEKPTSGDWTPLYLAQSAKEVKPAPDRSDAVNLARNFFAFADGNYSLEITHQGITALANAVLQMDAWILEVDRKSSDATSACLQPCLARSPTASTPDDAACERAAAILRAEADRLEYPRTMVPQESEKIARRQNAFRTAAHYLDPESKERIAQEVAEAYCPLHDDAQAMALVRKLQLCVLPPESASAGRWVVTGGIGLAGENEDLNRAICECVAKMQKAKS